MSISGEQAIVYCRVSTIGKQEKSTLLGSQEAARE